MINQDYFANRVSIRAYRHDTIPYDQIESIIEAAMRAPTCGNMQLYSVVVTEENERKTELAKLHFNQPAATTSSVILTICADFNLFTRWCLLNKADAKYDDFHSFVMAFTDAIIFAQQIVTVAENRGLGTCYLGTVNYNAEEISTLLNLPEKVVPVASIALGFPEFLPPQTDRLPVKALIHRETYKNFSDELVRDFFKYKEELPENKSYIEENNKESLAQVFTDIRYPDDLNKKVSKSFLSLIIDKGFQI